MRRIVPFIIGAMLWNRVKLRKGAKVATLTETNERRDDAWVTEQRLTAKLAEYDSLWHKAEARAHFQQGLVQAHMTVLGLLLVGALTNPVVEGRSGHWLVLPIPFESAVLGLYWLDQATHRRRLNRYLVDHIEQPINELLGGYPAMNWESSGRYQAFLTPAQRRALDTSYRFVHWALFAVPALVSLLLLTAYVVLTARYGNRYIISQDVAGNVAGFFPVAEEMEWARWACVLIVTVGGWLVFARYWGLAKVYWGMRHDDRDRL